jgi:hypothetical protein
VWEFFSERVALQKWEGAQPLVEIGLEPETESEPAPETPPAPAA